MRPLAIALSILALSGCVPVPIPPPSAVRPELAGSALGPLERLGRFTGDGFRVVTPESIPPSHVYVLVHGWAPGWGARAREEPRVRSWEITEPPDEFEPWVPALARVITEADPHAVVLAYSWLDDAATGRFVLAQRHAFAHTDLHGRWLAEALVSGTRQDFVEGAGSVHLIGHSYGARVVALAALYLPKRPRQLTFFDCPDSPMTHWTGSQSMLAGVLRKLPIGSAPGEVFVDNYVSMVGARYDGIAGIVDVVLAPPYGVMDYRSRHLYPMEFYAQTGRLGFGLGWSPLIAQRAPAGGCYQQEYGEIALARGCPGLP